MVLRPDGRGTLANVRVSGCRSLCGQALVTGRQTAQTLSRGQAAGQPSIRLGCSRAVHWTLRAPYRALVSTHAVDGDTLLFTVFPMEMSRGKMEREVVKMKLELS